MKGWQLTESCLQQERPQIGDGPAFGRSTLAESDCKA